jgi:putative SOS response-associated peptidase YedK
MCGRARLSSDVSEIKLVFSIPPERPAPNIAPSWNVAPTDPLPIANFGVSDRRFRFKPAGGFGGNRQAVSVQSGTPLRMGFGPGFGEPPLRDTSYLALACQSKYSCHYYSF